MQNNFVKISFFNIKDCTCAEFVKHLDKLERKIQTRFIELQHVCQMNFVVDPFSAEMKSHPGNSNAAFDKKASCMKVVFDMILQYCVFCAVNGSQNTDPGNLNAHFGNIGN